MVVAVSLRRDVEATLTRDKLNTKWVQKGPIYNKNDVRTPKVQNVTLEDEPS